MEHLVLTRRNLLTLLNKLDRVKETGEFSHCAIIKTDCQHPHYPQSMAAITVQAVEDKDYYTDRKPGAVLPVDDPNNVPNRES